MGHIHDNLKAIEQSPDPQAAANRVAANFVDKGAPQVDHMHQLAVAQVAAHWWRRVLESGRAPSLLEDAGYARDGVDATTLKQGAFGDGLIGLITRGMKRPSPEQLDMFEWALGMLIVEDCFVRGRLNYFTSLSTDYHPCQMIYRAGEAAGVEARNFDLRFPFKIYMRLDANFVEVRPGYSAAPQLLWMNKRALLVAEVSRLQNDRNYPPGEQPEKFDEEKYQQREALRERMRQAMLGLPEFFRGDPLAMAREFFEHVYDGAELPERCRMWTFAGEAP